MTAEPVELTCRSVVSEDVVVSFESEAGVTPAPELGEVIESAASDGGVVPVLVSGERILDSSWSAPDSVVS